jgi:hypothetical protein
LIHAVLDAFLQPRGKKRTMEHAGCNKCNDDACNANLVVHNVAPSVARVSYRGVPVIRRRQLLVRQELLKQSQHDGQRCILVKCFISNQHACLLCCVRERGGGGKTDGRRVAGRCWHHMLHSCRCSISRCGWLLANNDQNHKAQATVAL